MSVKHLFAQIKPLLNSAHVIREFKKYLQCVLHFSYSSCTTHISFGDNMPFKCKTDDPELNKTCFFHGK